MADGEGTEGADPSVADHDDADVVDAQRTVHVRLKREKWTYKYYVT